MRSDDDYKAGERGDTVYATGGPGQARRGEREPIEVALELTNLSAVLFVTACEARVGRGALLRASEALAEAPAHIHHDARRSLLGLVRAAGVALRGGIQALSAHELRQVNVANAVSIRLARIEGELTPA